MDMTDSTLVRDKPQSFTTVFNCSLDLIKDQGAFAIYVYLSQKPNDWIIRPSDVQKRFGIGRDKYLGGMRILKEIGLIETRTVHNSNGTFAAKKTVIHETPVETNHTIALKTRNTVKPTYGKPDPLVSTDYLVMKDSNNNSCASGDFHCGSFVLGIHSYILKSPWPSK